jgi:hypothetical protein
MNFLIQIAEFAQNRFHGVTTVKDTSDLEAASSTHEAEPLTSDPSSCSTGSPVQEDVAARRARDNLRQRFRQRGGLMVPEEAAFQQLAPVVEEASTSPEVLREAATADSQDMHLPREVRPEPKLPALSRWPPRQTMWDPYEPVKPSKDEPVKPWKLESGTLCNPVAGTWPPCKKACSRRKLEHITTFRKELVETLADNAATQNNRDLWMQCDRVGAALSATAASRHQLEPSESELQAKLFRLASSPQADLDEVRRLRRLLSKCGAAS